MDVVTSASLIEILTVIEAQIKQKTADHNGNGKSLHGVKTLTDNEKITQILSSLEIV